MRCPGKMSCPGKKMHLVKKRSEAGQSIIESALVLVVFLSLLFAVIDCGLVLVAHQSLVERTRAAVRWGVVHPWDGTGEQIANWILYDQPTEPLSSREGYLGLTRANVQVIHQPPSADRPDDELIRVAILNYHYQFLSPFLGVTKGLVSPRAVTISAPMAYKTTAYSAPAGQQISR